MCVAVASELPWHTICELFILGETRAGLSGLVKTSVRPGRLSKIDGRPGPKRQRAGWTGLLNIGPRRRLTQATTAIATSTETQEHRVRRSQAGVARGSHAFFSQAAYLASGLSAQVREKKVERSTVTPRSTKKSSRAVNIAPKIFLFLFRFKFVLWDPFLIQTVKKKKRYSVHMHTMYELFIMHAHKQTFCCIVKKSVQIKLSLYLKVKKK